MSKEKDYSQNRRRRWGMWIWILLRQESKVKLGKEGDFNLSKEL